MGYPSSAAGLAVSPRGLGALAIMPIVGVLTSRIDNRWLIALGFTVFGVTALWMAGLTLQISQWSLTWPMIIIRAAAGLIFVPLSTAAMGTLPNQQISNASGFFNLVHYIASRNV